MLYKYRSIKDFKFFVDIILNQRLFASPYFKLNDPMEGQYLYNKGELSSSLVSAIRGEKEKFRICSLSREPEHPLMWAHYADGHRGVVIGVDVDKNKYDVRPVLYTGLPHIQDYVSSDTAKNILCHKNAVWVYEEEERAFISKNNYLKVEVRKIILGSRNQDKMIIKKLVDKISPNIEIVDSTSDKIY
jgi:hypothetical protein